MKESIVIASDYEAHNAEMLAINERLVIAGIRQQEFAEVALRAEQRLRDLVHGLDAVICEVDMRTGQPAFLSLRAETFLGHPLERWHAQPDFLAEIIHSSDRDRAEALFPAFMQEGQDYEYEFRALSADTDWIWMRNIVRLVHDADGNVELLRCVIVDVTAQRKMAEELAAAGRRDQRIAVALQRSLLFMPPEDAFPGLAVKTMYETASDEALVGGDFWDTFAFDNGHVALVIGDVMGHGLTSAIFTAELKYTLRGFIREHEHPPLILYQLNQYLCQTHRLFREGLNDEGDEAPVCLTLVVLNTATGEGVVCSAGMEPPLLLRADGQMEEIRTRGLVLGVETDEEYRAETFQLGHGDLVLLTTDGITEARRGRSFLGYDGLMRLAQEGRKGTLEQMGQTILDGARAFAMGKLMDDACLLLARRH